MLIVYLFASTLGALTTLAVLASYGWLVALVYAPLGGSVVAMIASVVIIAFRGAKESSTPAALADPTS
jgi:hypothetical protein